MALGTVPNRILVVMENMNALDFIFEMNTIIVNKRKETFILVSNKTITVFFISYSFLFVREWFLMLKIISPSSYKNGIMARNNGLTSIKIIIPN